MADEEKKQSLEDWMAEERAPAWLAAPSAHTPTL